MPSVTPIITTTSTPAVQASMAGALTYDEFVFMLGILNLQLSKIFLQGSTNPQINGTFAWTELDSNGVINMHPLNPKVSPYFYQSAVYLDLPGPGFILNGLSYMSFNLLGGQSLSMRLGSNQVGPEDLVNNFHDNFAQYPDGMGNLQRYNEQRDYL